MDILDFGHSKYDLPVTFAENLGTRRLTLRNLWRIPSLVRTRSTFGSPPDLLIQIWLPGRHSNAAISTFDVLILHRFESRIFSNRCPF
jgi:hypothetical protein